ncbi:hypothetical protein JA1_000176 [Spathaspora sp. JA1]|nr:hypothetical protein JA1_000176 [Spathaspora sp. JA1]
MTEPILSYKRPSSRISPSTPTPPTSSPNPSNTQSPQPTTATTRKVSSRRKALQDFYNLQEQEKQQDKHEPKLDKDPDALPQPEELDEFIQTQPIQEILKLRNKITHTLNSQDSAKKSIIYDNYYELIKLSDTLLDLSKSHQQEVNGLGIYSEEPEKSQSKQEYIDSILSDLHGFINSNETSLFNRPFEEIIESDS